MRLIDADAVIMDILSAGKIGKLTCIDLIKHSKTIDAVPVVHCKDCKHRTLSGYCKMCWHSDGSYALDDEFCPMGAKMDGGEGE